MFYSYSKYTIDVSLYNSWFILNISLSTSQLAILHGSVFVGLCVCVCLQFLSCVSICLRVLVCVPPPPHE